MVYLSYTCCKNDRAGAGMPPREWYEIAVRGPALLDEAAVGRVSFDRWRRS